MARRYLGYGYTNAQGIAKLEYDAEGTPIEHSYTGVGAGKIDIVAESSSLQSETYTILDAIFYDHGITSDYNNSWENTSSRLTVSRDTSGTLLSNSSGSNGFYICCRNIIAPFCIEFNIISITGQSYVTFDGTTSSKVRLDSRLSGGEAVRLEFADNVTKIYINDEYNAEFTTSSLKYTAFLLYNEASLKYSDWKVYPI